MKSFIFEKIYNLRLKILENQRQLSRQYQQFVAVYINLGLMALALLILVNSVWLLLISKPFNQVSRNTIFGR